MPVVTSILLIAAQTRSIFYYHAKSIVNILYIAAIVLCY